MTPTSLTQKWMRIYRINPDYKGDVEKVLAKKKQPRRTAALLMSQSPAGLLRPHDVMERRENHD